MSTTKVFRHTISYSLSENGIHLINDLALHQLIRENPKRGVKQLVKNLKDHFRSKKQTELKITDESLKTEIWGHYYFEKIYFPFRGLLKFFFPKKLVARLDLSLEEYDCGEQGFDPNRCIWDILSKFNGLFSLFLRDNENRP